MLSTLNSASFHNIDKFADNNYYSPRIGYCYYCVIGKLCIVNLNVDCISPSSENNWILNDLPEPATTNHVYGSMINVDATPSEDSLMLLERGSSICLRFGISNKNYVGVVIYPIK